MVKNPFFFVADLHIFGEFQQQNPSRPGCRLLSGEIDWLAEEKKVIEEPLVDVFFGILSLAISGTEIGGTYHIKGLYKAYVREYPSKIWPYMVQTSILGSWNDH
jgi:hypothetical protein